MALSQNFRHRSAETRANRLLCLPKLGRIDSSDRSAAKKTDYGYQGKGCPCRTSSELNLLLFHCMMSEVNPCVTINSAQF